MALNTLVDSFLSQSENVWDYTPNIDALRSQIHVVDCVCTLHAGWMTSCLGYLGVTINDRMELEELFHFDVLVTCPPYFNVTFSLPNWSSRPDRTFDVTLDDAQASYRVFITTITFQRDDLVTCAADTHNHDVVGAGLAVRDWSMMALMSVIITASVLVFAACVYAFLETSARTRRYQTSAADEHDVALTGSHLQDATFYDVRRCRTIVVVRVLLCVVFALSCTFTTCSSLFYVSQRQHINDARQLSADKRRFDVATAAVWDQLAEYLARRPAADVARVREMQLACDGYVSELATAVTDRIAVEAKTADVGRESAVRMYRRATSQVADEVEKLLVDIRQWLGVQLRPAGAGFRRVVKRSLNLPWLSYAQSLFNKSVELSPRSTQPPSTSSDDVSFLLPPEIATFAEFLRISNVEEVRSWHRQFMDRLVRRVRVISFDTY